MPRVILSKNRSSHVSPIKGNPTMAQSKAEVLSTSYAPDLFLLCSPCLSQPDTLLPFQTHEAHSCLGTFTFLLPRTFFSRISAHLARLPPWLFVQWWSLLSEQQTPSLPELFLPSMFLFSPSQFLNANMLHNFIVCLLPLECKLVGTGILYLLSEWMMPYAE